jgi:hypothetical protein
MVQGIKDPTTGKTFTYKGFTPISRISIPCQHGFHDCPSAPSALIKVLDFNTTKSVCCLCNCHFEGGK